MEIIIRPARLADIPGIRKLITRYSKEKRLVQRSEKEIRQVLRSFFVAAADGDVIGCAALEVYSKKMAEVRSLAVDRGWKGMNLGSLLIESCLRRAKSRGVKEVMAITSRAEKLFEKMGFGFALPNERKALFYWTK